jgi:hypothetical protein
VATEPPAPQDESIPEEFRELTAVADALMDPDNHDPFITYNFFKNLELSAIAKAKLASEALAVAAAPPKVEPPKPSEPVRPAPQPEFKGNRRARRAAARRARKSG